MSEECNHVCEGCHENCDHRIEKIKLNEMSKVKKIIGVVSSKGGVGKSLVSSLLAKIIQEKGLNTAILDADITGPSIPKAFGLKNKAYGENGIIFPSVSKTGVQIISANLLLEDDEDPIIWRGPMLGDLVKQFYSEVFWNDVDYMIVDLPPGTSDIALTTYQYLPIDGIIIVTSPQELVTSIVKKAIKMVNEMNIPILGIVENMSYVECSHCKEKIFVFGKSNIDEVSKQFNIEVLAKLPLKEEIAQQIDAGNVEDIIMPELDLAIEKILKL